MPYPIPTYPRTNYPTPFTPTQAIFVFLKYSKLFPMTGFEPTALTAWNAQPPDLNTVDFSSSFESQFSAITSAIILLSC